MSVKPRPRSAAKKPVRDLSSKLHDSPDSGLRPRIISAVRIEQRLFNHLANSKRKLELLKQSLLKEELKEVQSKPKILSKSRILAEKAEQRLLDHNPYLSSPSSQNIEKPSQGKPTSEHLVSSTLKELQAERSIPFSPVPQVQPEPSSRVGLKSKTTSSKFLSRGQKRTKSLLNLTVLERNEAWLEEKKSKLTKRKKEMEQKDMAECTFSPKTQNKLKQSRSFRDPYSNTSFISSPNSLDISECHEINPKTTSKTRLYRQIAPYRVNISFKCGIDLNSFLRRAK